MHDPIIIDTRSIWKLAALLCLCALAPAAVRAQAVAPPPADTTASPPVPVDTVRSAPTQADDDDLIEMSPFVVDSTKDSRYLAASSLSGSRLNTELRNVAAVIDVFTAEIIQDFGIGDLDDLMDYAANLQGGNSTIGGWGNAADTGSSFTVRGLPASRARNYFNYYYVTDTYNVERVDESRGPNAILFGFGSPGGILNISTKKARTNRNRIILGTQVSNFMAKRMTLDANQVLVKDRLALRLNAVTQSRETWRDFSRDDRNGVHAAMTFTPWKKSALYLEYEHFQRAESAARGGNTYWSQTDTWEEAGKPLIHTGYGNRNNVANNPLLAGDAAKINTLANLGARDVWVHTEETGVLANWNNMSRTNRASYTDADGNVWTAFGDFRHTRTDVPGILEVNLMGPSSVRKTKYDLGFVTWQQEIVKNLFLEAAATWQDAHWDAVRYGNVTLYADPNYYLPDGGAGSTGPAAVNPVKNPYAGNYYVEGVPQFWVSDSRVENYRVTLSYELNLGKNLGRHRFAFLAERDEFEILTVARTELARVDGVIATQTANNPTNAVGNINRRHYITDPTNPRDYRMPPVYGIPVPLDMMTPDGRRLTTELANRFSADQPDYWKTINTTMVVLQSAWLSGHLNTIFGMRHDKATYRDWGTYKIKPDQGAFERDPNNFAVTSYPGRTYTYAAVAHLTTWLSAFFNASTSVGEPRYKVSYAPDGRQMETMTGIGKDIGIKFSIPRTQLQGIVTFYDATSTNEPLTDGVTTFVNNNNRILSSLVDSGVMTQSEVAYLHARGSGDTADAATKGVEAVMVGNVTKNWSIRASYSYTNRTVTRVFPRMNEWMDNVMKPFWEMLAERVNPYSPDGLSILDSVMYSGRPIRELAETMTTDLRQNTLSSSKVRGTRPHKVRIFTTYGFESGALKGLRIGGGFLYDSPGILEQDDRGKNRYGSSFTRYDFMMAYTRRMLKANWTIQLNINNCFHPKAAVNGPAFINPAGTWESIGVIAPREISLSVRTVF